MVNWHRLWGGDILHPSTITWASRIATTATTMNATRRDKENPATNSNSISLYIPWNKHITYPLKLTNGVFKMNFPIFRGDSVYFSGEVIKWSKGVEFLTKFRSTPGYVRMEPRKENPMGSRWFVRFMMVCWIVIPVFFAICMKYMIDITIDGAGEREITIYHN